MVAVVSWEGEKAAFEIGDEVTYRDVSLWDYRGKIVDFASDTLALVLWYWPSNPHRPMKKPVIEHVMNLRKIETGGKR